MSTYQNSGYRPRGYSSGYPSRSRGGGSGGGNNRGGSSRGRFNNGYQQTSHTSYRQRQTPATSSYKARQNVYQQHSTPLRNNDFQMWMGDLDPQWTEESIDNLWTKLVSKPHHVKIMRDRLQPLKPSYCFVTFRDQESIDLAIQRNGQKVPDSNRVFKLNYSGRNSTGSHDRSTNLSNEYSIFIGDLAPEVSDAALYNKFNMKYPNQIKQAKVITDSSTRKSKGFGFVKFHSPDIMNRALKEMQGYNIGSKAIRVGLAAGSHVDTSSKPVTKLDHHRVPVPQLQPALNQFTDPNNTSFTIGGLSGRITESELEQHFIGFGDLVYCRVSKDYQTGYIKFYSRSAAESAFLNMYGFMINDCRLQITWGSCVQVSGASVNYLPNVAGEIYEKAKKSPAIYHHPNYPYLRFDKLSSDEIKKLPQRLDGSDVLTTSQIDEFYLNNKRYREKLLNDALY